VEPAMGEPDAEGDNGINMSQSSGRTKFKPQSEVWRVVWHTLLILGPGVNVLPLPRQIAGERSRESLP
jgi:hypothetical protein